MKKIQALAFFISLMLVQLQAQTITMPRILSNNMVLQQNTQIKIWGWAAQGTVVDVSANWGQNVSTSADASGNWVALLQTPVAVAGEAPTYTITAKGPVNTLTFNNILVGEVWLTTGQSNMWLPMRWWRTYNQTEIAAANYPNIRMFMVDYKAYNLVPATTPQKNLPIGSWKACNPANVDSFSIIPYFFARELYNNKNLNVPIGIISVAWGGKAISEFVAGGGVYNTYIAPLIPYQIKGMLWYQGEANATSGSWYGSTQNAMVTDWRTKWGKEFPFYAVQIASYFNAKTITKDLNYVYPLFREYQNTILNLAKTGIVVNTDLTLDSANLYEIHPQRKLEIGQRLAALALANDYGQTIQCTGPTFLSKTIEGSKIRIGYKTESLGAGLITKDGKHVTNFRIAGSDNKFYPANAVIDGNTIVVWSDLVQQPVNVRYAFSDGAITNLQNKEGFPAFPFRTDNLSGTTGAVYMDMPYPIPTSVKHVEQNEVKVTPNPFHDYFVIPAMGDNQAKIELLDTLGKKINVGKNSTANSITVNTSHLKSGIYFLTISQNNGQKFYSKILKI